MKSLKEHTIKSIQISVGGFERPLKVERDLKGNYPPMGILENIYIEQGEVEHLHDVHFTFKDFIEMYPSAKIERIIFEK